MHVLSLAVLKVLLNFHTTLPQPQNPGSPRSISWTRRQALTNSDSSTVASSTRTSPTQPLHSSVSSQYSTTSTPQPATAITTYTKPTSSPRPGVGTAQDSSSAGEGLDVKAITFSVIGGVLGILLLSLIIYQLVRRHKKKSAPRDKHEAFWEKWRWGVYSPVHGDVIYPDQALPTTSVMAAQGNKGKEKSGSWWQKLGVFRPLVGGQRSAKNKPSAGTLYRVKRLKPGERFEIDSVGDLTTIASR